MKHTAFLFTIFFLAMTGKMKAQDLSKHQWKNRVILLLTDDLNNLTFKNQLAELKKDIDGMTDRKLIVYKVTPKKYSLGLEGESLWTSSEIYAETKRSKAPFEIFLIGLDGGVKLHQTELLSIEKLFGIIDGMPMRRTEINQTKN